MTDAGQLKVVPIRDGLPSLRDIAGWLRVQADRVEAAEVADIRTMVLVLHTGDGRVPSPCVFGDSPSRMEVVGLLTTAATKAQTMEWDNDD